MGLSNFHQWRNFAREAFGFSMLMVKGFCLVQLTRNYLFNFAFVMGPSMLPTINLTGNVVLVDRISLRRDKIGRGDVVLVRTPENPRKIVTKRMIGMEGDCITFIADPRNNENSESVVVPQGHVWVQGGNIYDSRDSRHFGAVPYALLQGRVCWRVWPLNILDPCDYRVNCQSTSKIVITFAHLSANVTSSFHLVAGISC